ncbi:MAG: SRPBCC domain-containing protein [Chitinophagaceae bacterium]
MGTTLYYPQSEKESKGKTAEKEDRFTARFVELVPHNKIVEAITFDSPDKNFAGEMIMDITLEPKDNKTSATFLFKNIPPGIKPADNEAGTIETLEKLARYIE